MNLVTQRMGEVRRCEALVRCDNCSRILYDPEALKASGAPVGE
jgi:predicted  nucleic acid-binding Zn-ribbon protein